MKCKWWNKKGFYVLNQQAIAHCENGAKCPKGVDADCNINHRPQVSKGETMKTKTVYVEGQEPLAVLGARKGYQYLEIRNGDRIYSWQIWFTSSPCWTGKTYNEAESKARLFLESLSDRKGAK